MAIHFAPPFHEGGYSDGDLHHQQAAAGNQRAAHSASREFQAALDGASDYRTFLIKAAAGAGKSYVLQRLVIDAVNHAKCSRVAVTAFQNQQVWPLAENLGNSLGANQVCLFVAADRVPDVPAHVLSSVQLATSTASIPPECTVVIGTSHKLGVDGERSRLLSHLGAAHISADAVESPFTVLFVDEAWQLPHHRFDKVRSLAPIVVGVGDVGQLAPIEVGTNPWRGDPGYNPYRAWPTGAEDEEGTWACELPTVWRPTAAQLPLWREFYPEWTELNSVAAPGDRRVEIENTGSPLSAIWQQVATGTPTLLEVHGLPPAEAADVDIPIMNFTEDLVDHLFTQGFAIESVRYADDGEPTSDRLVIEPGGASNDPLVVILATRNQAVDDAMDLAERLREKHNLSERDLHASTVDKWQGQTNAITIAIHPLSGALGLDEFNSAFGRLAVACTRATHGLLVLTRPGLDQLLNEAPARPGTPYGEPGNRNLPRQTHQRILATFARGSIAVTDVELTNQ